MHLPFLIISSALLFRLYHSVNGMGLCTDIVCFNISFPYESVTVAHFDRSVCLVYIVHFVIRD